MNQNDEQENATDESKDNNEPLKTRHDVSAAEVARRASVSLMTVSRVFGGSNLVSGKTRDNVLKIAQEIGYQPNRAARLLRTKRSGLIGFMVKTYVSLRGEFHSEAFVAFESVLSSNDINVMISIATPGQSISDQAKKLIVSSRCEAIAARFDVLTRKDIEELAALDTPVILVNYNPVLEKNPVKISSIGYDNIKGIQQAVRYLASLEHRRIAYLGGTHGWSDSMQREYGFRTGMKEVGLEVNEEWIQECAFGEGYGLGIEKMIHIFASSIPGPTAVVCASDEIAVGAMIAATRWGKSVPKDFSVIGFDDRTWGEYITPAITTIRHHGWELGERAAQYLMEYIENPSNSPQTIVLDTQLIIRESTRIAPPQ